MSILYNEVNERELNKIKEAKDGPNIKKDKRLLQLGTKF